jgi:EmrB/QacA subfamily drug resistance transporter
MMTLVVVGFGIFVAADDLTVVTTMLRPIIGDLGIVLPDGLDDAAWIVNAYLVAYVAVMPFMGRLSDLLGRRRVYIGALTIFLIGSIIIPMTSSLGPFLIGRVLTALGGGALVPIGMAVVGDAFTESRRARALGTLGAIDTLGWVWGPLFGAFLVRFLSWEWQFYLNIPLALIGIAAAWWALSDAEPGTRRGRIDWAGAVTLTGALVCLNLALLGSAEVQSVSGLDELTGSTGEELRWLYLPAIVLAILFVRRQRRADDPLIDPALFKGRNLSAAVMVNFFVGAALVIAMVDVPIFVNQVEGNLERAAVASGWVLSALTASMAIAAYAGGRFTERTWYRPPVLVGLGVAAAAFLLLGGSWAVDTAFSTMGWQLALLGVGFGLVIAPTSAAVVDAAPPDRRGTAASVVMVVRLMGLSVGLSALTAWGLYRFNQLRGSLVLPPLDDPGYAQSLQAAQAELTTSALAETFVAAAVVVLVALVIAMGMRRDSGLDPGPRRQTTDDRPQIDQRDPAGPEGRKEARMQEKIRRNLGWIVAIFGSVLVVALVVAFVALGRSASLSTELDEARSDLAQAEADLAALAKDFEQVQGGTALFAAQVTAFQDQLAGLAPSVAAGIGDAVDGLDAFATSTLEFQVPINEDIPIETVIDLNRTITVPIQTTIPIDETVDTTITVAGPFGIDIPLNVTVPVQLNLPVALDVSFAINEQIPVSTSVPVNLDLPIAIDIADTELATLVSSLRIGLASMQDILGGLG